MRHHVFPAGFWKTSEHQQLMWQFALRSWWNLTEKLQKQSFTYQQLLFFCLFFYKSTTRLFNTQVFVPLISHCLHSWNIQLRWQSSSWNLHTHTQRHTRRFILEVIWHQSRFQKTKTSEREMPTGKLTRSKNEESWDAFISVFVSGGHPVAKLQWESCSVSIHRDKVQRHGAKL